MSLFNKPALRAAATVALLAVLAACKPNETAYKAAYEAALAKQHEQAQADTAGLADPGKTIYTQYRDQAVTRPLALGADTIDVTTEIVSVAEGLPADRLGRYSVVVGRFKQIFNARQMQQRLLDAGYADAFIIQTREPLYYNAVATTDMAAAALEALRRVEADTTLRLRQPMPFVLEAATKRR